MVNQQVPLNLRGELLAYHIGHRCGEKDGEVFTFVSVDKAFNEYYPVITDQIREKGWPVPSRDAIDRQFRRGYKDGELERQKAELRSKGIIV